MKGGASADVCESSPMQRCTDRVQEIRCMVSTDDAHLLEMLRSGNEVVFTLLFNLYTSTMVRLAMNYVTARAVAEEVVQETWLAVLEGLNCFEGRSSLKTWMFRILTNIAKTQAKRERRSIPFSLLANDSRDFAMPVVDVDCCPSTDDLWADHRVSFPSSWEMVPETWLQSQETSTCIEEAMNMLPSSQRIIMILRDIEGCTSDETCRMLGISEGNQRVLLHRARAKVRRMLEHYFEDQ
jgi:RNA polymerase sigma-70 factor, ECF subfamily